MGREILPKVLPGADARAPPSSLSLDDYVLRRFRTELLSQVWTPDMMPLARCPDLHSLSRLRDCFFHPLEHEYSLLEVQDMLDQLGLRLLCLHGSGLTELFH